MVETTHPDDRIENPSVRHERTDANVRGILWCAAGFVILAVLIHFALQGMFTGYKSHEARVKASTFPLAEQQRREQGRPLPPAPRLEPIDRVERLPDSDLEHRLAAQNAALQDYGPTPEAGYIHIPIEQAMRLLENKLPARQESAEKEQPRRQTNEGGGKQ